MRTRNRLVLVNERRKKQKLCGASNVQWETGSEADDALNVGVFFFSSCYPEIRAAIGFPSIKSEALPP